MGVIASGASAPTDSKQTGQNSQASPVRGAHGGKEAPWRGYQRVLKRYFGPNFDEKQARNEKYLCRFLNKYQVHVLLATLPDPSDSHLADSFDNYLASIQLALANDHYLIDEYWLPEAVRRKEAAKAILADQPHALVLTPIGKPVGSMSSVLAKAKEPDLLDQPGIMLFRRKLPDIRPELLVLLIVPETPTSGVRQTALRGAFEQAASLDCGQDRTGQPRSMRMIGPSFSGAAVSLARGIEDWPDHGKFKFNIITGSATNIENASILGAVGDFSATVTPDDVMRDFYRYVVQKFKPSWPIIPILTESNTSYGQGASHRPGEERSKNVLRKLEDCKDSNPCILELPFPLHVSQLGAEYEKARAQRAASAPSEGLSRLLSLNLVAEDEPSDVPPAMSPLTKYNSDLSLLNSVMAIARAHLNVVGIQATDRRDELFLAQKVRQIVPDAQLFFLESELLFSHTEIAGEMRGALVVSRYPLFNLNQLWTPPRQLSPRLQFPNGSSQGVYNAAILQLQKLDREKTHSEGLARWEPKSNRGTLVSTSPEHALREQPSATAGTGGSSQEDDGIKPLEYGEPFKLNSHRPPWLWVGMVGHGGVWPIGTLGPDGSLHEQRTEKCYPLAEAVPEEPEVPKDTLSNKVKRYTEDFPWTDKKIPLAIPKGFLHSLATALLFLIIVWHAARCLRFSKKPSAMGYAGVQFLGWQALIAIYLAAVGPIVAPRMAERNLALQECVTPIKALSQGVLKAGLGSVAVCALLVFLLCVQLIWRIFHRSAAAKRSAFEIVTFVFCVLAGIALTYLAGVHFHEIVFSANDASKIFLWVRTENWLSGISPMLPLVFLGAAVYATTWLNHFRLGPISAEEEDQRIESPQPLHELVPGNEALEKREAAADAVAQGRRLVGGSWLFVFTVLTVGIVVLFTIRLNAESHSWTRLVRVLLGLLILGTVHGLVLLAQQWRTIRKMLDTLFGHPVLSIMESMRKQLAAMVGLHSYAAAPNRSQVLASEGAHFIALKRLFPNDSKLQAIDSVGRGVRWAANAMMGNGWWYAADGSGPRTAAELVVLEIVRGLGRRVAVIRALIGVLTIDALILLMVTRLYPLQPRSLLSGLSWFLLLLVVITSVWVLVEMERNAVLSYASGSEPGKLTWDASFVAHLALFVGIPVIALVGAYFPEIGGPILDSLQPLLRSAR